MDVTAHSFMREFGFLARNAERFAQQVDPAAAERASRLSGLFDLEQQALRQNRCSCQPLFVLSWALPHLFFTIANGPRIPKIP